MGRQGWEIERLKPEERKAEDELKGRNEARAWE
jgi:hypothetical protein